MKLYAITTPNTVVYVKATSRREAIKKHCGTIEEIAKGLKLILTVKRAM